MHTPPKSLLALCLAMLTSTAIAGLTAPAEIDPVEACYEIDWDTPSEDAHGTMPLGNGEVGVNVWVDPAGDLNFFLSRTDSLDEYGRVMKVGGGKIVMPKPDEDYDRGANADTSICLDVLNGVLHVFIDNYDVKMWVDAHRPVVVVEAMEISKSYSHTPADPPEFQMQVWRTAPGEEVVASEVADMLQPWKTVMRIRPDVVLNAEQAGENTVGWYHHNAETFGYDEAAKTQGMDDFPRENPLLHRTFGALVESYSKETEPRPETFRNTPDTTYIFEIAVHTSHPSTPDQWLRETKEILAEAEKTPLEERYWNHVAWWNDFWQRSWIHLTPADEALINTGEKPAQTAPAFYTAHPRPLRVGVDSDGGSRFAGNIQYFKAWQFVKDKDGVQTRESLAAFQKIPAEIPGSDAWSFPRGGEFFLKIRTPEKFTAYGRLLDKITAGGSDGFLLDITPEGKLRLIVGQEMLFSAEPLKPGDEYTLWFTFNDADGVTVKVDGEKVIHQPHSVSMLEETELLTRAYLLQRYIDACAGRGNFLAQFNGSIFTVPHEGKPGFADYRRWGTGYWWQNMRLTRYAFFMSGDHDQLRNFLEAYHRLLPVCEYRAEKYFGFKNAAYYPECIYAWGDVFTETYGTVPWNEKPDPLQASGWHKWEWVGGLELACMMLAYYDFTGDETFLREKAIPLAESVTRFFDAYYKTDETTGKLIMHPSQALETWWECTNPAPEVAGLHATLNRLLAIPENLTTEEEREAWQTLLAKIPDIPVWTDENGVKRLAPGEKFASKRNIENPELYPVFPFRLVSFEKPLREEAVNALNLRWDRGALGWRQDDLFMAYLGLSDQAADYLIQRARRKNAQSRFPAFWGPNYDWTPDQCHGGVLTAGIQSLLMQTDGRKIYLLPAFPAKWNADFKLHAPHNTVIECRVENGMVTSLTVTPEERRKDVILCEPFTF